MYGTLRHDYYWTNMLAQIYIESDVFNISPQLGTHFRFQRHLQLNSTKVANLNLLELTCSVDQCHPSLTINFLVITTARYSELTCAVPKINIQATHVTYNLFNDWVLPYELPDIMLSDKANNLSINVFTSLCNYLLFKTLTTTAHHPQINGQMERYNRTIVLRLRLYDIHNQQSWNTFVQQLIYAHNC